MPPGPLLWATMDARPRISMRDLTASELPDTPGVYALYVDRIEVWSVIETYGRYEVARVFPSRPLPQVKRAPNQPPRQAGLGAARFEHAKPTR